MKAIRISTGGVVLLAGLGLMACGSDSTNPPPPPGLTVARASTASGDGQQGTVGLALANPLRVQVTRGGVAEAGATVTWTAVGTGASMDPGSSTTGADGIASATWTLSHGAGVNTAAAAVSGASGSPVSFSATAAAGAATQVATGSGTGQTGTVATALASPFRVVVRDGFGNAVAGTSVAWAVTGGGGSIAPATSTSDVNGSASATLTLGPAAGVNTATATATGLTGSPVTFTATGQAVATGSAVSVGNDFFAPASLQVAAGTTVTWTWAAGATSHSVQSQGSPSFTSSAIMTGAGSSYSVQFNTPGTYNYDCAVHGAAMSGTIIVQ